MNRLWSICFFKFLTVEKLLGFLENDIDKIDSLKTLFINKSSIKLTQNPNFPVL